MTIHILPTNDVISEVFKKAQEMQCLDFDIEEMVRDVLNTLTYRDSYPNGLSTILMESRPQFNINLLSEEDINILNEMLSLLYHRIHNAIVSLGLYDSTGLLHHVYFQIYRNDIAISDIPIADNPTS